MTEHLDFPRISVRGGSSCTPRQAAAAIAAVERFLRDHARPADAVLPALESGWVLAARKEAVDRS